MFSKIKIVANFYVISHENDARAKFEKPIKSVKVAVRRGSRVRDLVIAAMVKADFMDDFSALSSQYLSKRFDKFLPVDFEKKIKQGRQYNIDVMPKFKIDDSIEASTAGSDTLPLEFHEMPIWIDESKIIPVRRIKSCLGICIDSEKLPTNLVAEKFPEGNMNLCDEEFNPMLYLLQNHGFASLSDLCNGLQYLKEDIEKQMCALKEVNSGNMDSLFGIMNALSMLQSEMDYERRAGNWPISKSLEAKIVEVKTLLDELCQKEH